MKKTLKIIGIVILILLVVLILAPILFKSQIETAVKKSINNNVNATVEWQDLSLSLLSSFPDAQLTLSDVSVINNAPFKGDTLISAQSISLDMGILQLIKGDDPLSVNDLSIEEALVNIKVNKAGKANYDIAKESGQKTDTSSSGGGGMALDVQHYEIENSRINYLDEKSQMFLMLKKFNHEGTGDFSTDIFNLSTHTDAIVSFAMEGTNYLDNNTIKLDADLKMNLNEMKFSFLENKLLINQLPLKFDGYLQMLDDAQEMDINFSTPNSDFKNLLGLVPEKYSKNLDGVETSGDFNLDGRIYGTVDDTHIPKMNVALKSQNASFHYPDLPKTVKNIQLDASLTNTSGKMEDFIVDINKFHFLIDQDEFGGRATIKDLMGNQKVDLKATGQLNLANLEKAYPLDLETNLTGKLNMDIAANFDMNSIEKEQYQNVKTQGNAQLNNFVFKTDQLPNPFKIDVAALDFNTRKIRLQKLNSSTGQSDLNATGNLENLVGFMVSDQDLKGDFKINSNTIAINDLLPKSPDSKTPSEKEEGQEKPQDGQTESGGMKIPGFLDINVDFKVDKILYDNLALKNATGQLAIKDQTAILKSISADIFGGKIGLDGQVSTKTAVPNFNMNLNLNRIGIAQSVSDMQLLSGLAPIVKALQGDLSTQIDLKGNLSPSLTPVLNTLTGSASAKILDAKVNTAGMPLASQLDSELDFISLDNLKLDDIKTDFSFNDGKVQVKPFDFKIKDIQIEASGYHRLDQSMDYTLNFKLPAKYLGNEISSKLSQLTGSELQNTTVSLPVGLTGSFQSPQVKLNMQSAVQSLTQKIVEEQKQNLKEKAGDKIKELLGGNKTGDDDQNNGKKSDEEKVKDAAKDVLNGIFGKKKKDKK